VLKRPPFLLYLKYNMYPPTFGKAEVIEPIVKVNPKGFILKHSNASHTENYLTEEYTLPIASDSVLGGVKIDGGGLTINALTGLISLTGGGSGTGSIITNNDNSAYVLDLPFVRAATDVAPADSILAWDDIGDSLHVYGGAYADTDVVAYASGPPAIDFWSDMPGPSTTTRGGIIYDDVITHFLRGDGVWAETSAAPLIHNLIDTTNHPVSGLTTGHFLKATGATTYGFAAHGLSYGDVGAIADPGTSVDRELLTWNGTGGDSIRVSTGALISSAGHITSSADVIAYQSGSPSTDFWDDMPAATSTDMGGFILNATQMEMNAGVLSIKDSVLIPASHNQAWSTITTTPTTVSGYGITDAMTTAHAANGITSTNISNWGTAYSHSSLTNNPHNVTVSQIGAIADPGTSVDRELLTWNGITGDAIRVSTGASVTSAGHITCAADMIAYQSGSPSGDYWDDMPAATNSTMGGFILWDTQFTMTAGVLKIKDSISLNGIFIKPVYKS